jgi:hypothetical protein
VAFANTGPTGVTLSAIIDRLGAELVQCPDACSGICNEPSIGVLPRCLILEDGASGERGCLAVGLNPGRSPDTERAYYREVGPSYQAVKDYWHSTGRNFQYYAKSRRMIAALGLRGSIVWSDLAKCENSNGSDRAPPLQTLRHCSRVFLRRELDAILPHWPVLGIGLDAYRAAAFMVPERTVIGFPHPTGAYGRFGALFDGSVLTSDVANRAMAALTSAEPTSVWLGRGNVGV